MTLTELWQIAVSLAAGLVIGVMFYGGLWWTVRRGTESSVPALWFTGSLILRGGAAMTGFYLVAGGEWRLLLACLAGFTCGRLLVGFHRRVRVSAAVDTQRNHAP